MFVISSTRMVARKGNDTFNHRIRKTKSEVADFVTGAQVHEYSLNGCGFMAKFGSSNMDKVIPIKTLV